MSVFFIFFVMPIAIFMIVVFNSIKIVKEYQRIVVFRLGKNYGVFGPGVVFVWPFIDQPVWVDLRESAFEIAKVDCITKDGAKVAIEVKIKWQITDPSASVINVKDLGGSSTEVAGKSVREALSECSLADIPFKQKEIGLIIKEKIKIAMKNWGVKIISVEIK